MRVLPATNPIDRRVWIGSAVGLGLIGGALTWWLLRDKTPANAIGKVVCPNTRYPGQLAVGDYVVIELAAITGVLSEPTWAEVMEVGQEDVLVKIVGETAPGEEPKPLATSSHGFALGQELRLEPGCIFDRFRPGQPWRVLCGPALEGTGFAPIDRQHASLIGNDDIVRIVVRGARGGTEAMWLNVNAVSAGQQTIFGVIIAPTHFTDHGLKQGDVVEFLRDCVVEAQFGMEQ